MNIEKSFQGMEIAKQHWKYVESVICFHSEEDAFSSEQGYLDGFCDGWDLLPEQELDVFKLDYVFHYQSAYKHGRKHRLEADIRNIVLDWGNKNGILTNSDAKSQFIKFMEEAGELAKAILEQDIPMIIDGIGDVRITLILLSNLLGFNDDECLKTAYSEIKDRKGKMIEGAFVR